MARELATLDFETDPFCIGKIPKPFVCGVYTESEGFVYFWDKDCAKQAAEYIAARDLRVYAHNGGKFDYFYMLPFLENKLKIIHGRISQAKCGRSSLFDSYNILPVPLAAFEKDEFDYSKMLEHNREKYRGEIISYLRNDCIYLHEKVSIFQELYGKKLTLASTALNYFKEQRRNMGKEVPPNTSESFYNFFRPYYFGGRVECFKHGVHKGDFSYFDINSAYPYAMNYEHPNTKRFLPRHEIIPDEMTRTFYTIECKSLGALPLKDSLGRLRFPADNEKRVYHCTGWELKAGITTGTVSEIKVLKAWFFPETINFKAYVDDFYSMKKEAKESGDHNLYMISKLMQNSLYGKFAVNPAKFKDYSLVKIGDVKARRKLKSNGWDGGEIINDEFMVYQKKAKIPGKYLNVATGASITGFVRAFLWKNICSVEEPLYCDTDSIICKGRGDLILGKELGEWECETSEIKRVAIAGKKTYSLFLKDGSTKKACKGANLSAEEIERVALGETITYRREAPTYSTSSGIRFIEREVRATY